MPNEFIRALASRLAKIKPDEPTLQKVTPFIAETSLAAEKLCDELNAELGRRDVPGTASIEIDEVGFRARLIVADRYAVIDVSQQTEGTSFELRGAILAKFRCPVKGLAQPLLRVGDPVLFTPAELAQRLINALGKKCIGG